MRALDRQARGCGERVITCRPVWREPNRVLKIADRLIEPAQGAERATTMQVAASMLRTQSKRLLAVCKRILGAAHVEQQRAQIGMHIGVLRSFGKRKVVLGKGVLMVFERRERIAETETKHRILWS